MRCTDLEGDGEILMAKWPWRRISVWVVLGAFLYLLRDLLPLLFLTFIFSYIADGIVERLMKVRPYRRFFTTLVFLSFFSLFAILVSFAVPQIYHEARRGVRVVATTIQAHDETQENGPPALVEQGSRRLIGHEIYDRLADSPFSRRFLDEGERLVTALLKRIVSGVGDFIAGGFRLIFFAAIAGILAFIIVWDLPRIRASIALLERGRFAEHYREIYPMILSLMTYVGQAFQSLIAIAAINGGQMFPILWLFDVPEVMLLATIVFFFSLIPVFGLLVAFIPVALFTFQAGGLGVLVMVAILYFGLNIAETYTINAWIMSRFFRSHILLVLVLLLIGEHLFGIWGLLLAVPLGHYAIEYGLLGKQPATYSAT